eukprot:c21401_g1_i1 orf=126-653(+)
MEFPGRSASSDRSLTDMLQSASSLLSSHSDLLQGASSLFSSNAQQPTHAAPHAAETPASAAPASAGDEGKEEPKEGDVLSSAQVVFQAVKAKFHAGEGEAQEIDTARVAGALGDLVGAAGHYTKLDESKYGEYVHKAEEYLHSYEHKHRHPSAGAVPSYSSSNAPPPAQREDQGK